ncbi:importin [Salix suchowensis]|nr:importin [Salix suchowensis]
MVTTTTTSAPPRRVSARAVPPRSLLPLRFKAKLLPGRGNPSKARNWSPPSPSRLGPSSLSSQESPLHSVAPLPRSSPCSTRDYLRNKAIKILESVDALPLTCFLNELNFPENSIDLMDARKLLNYLKKNYLTSFCLCLEYAFDVLCQILTENKHDLWQETSFMNKELKSALLDCLNTESSIEILHKISDFVATIATKEVRLGNEWPELLEFVYESISSDSDSEEKVKCAISLLFKLIPQCAVEDMVISIDSFYESLVDIFDSEEMSLEVQVEATLASIRFLCHWTNRWDHDRYSTVLLVEIVLTISTLIEQRSDKDLQALVDELTVLAKEKPWSLSSQFDYLVLSVLRIADGVELQDKTKIIALEFVVALAEKRVEGRRMLRGSQLIIPKVLEKILFLLANLEDNPETGTAETDIQNLPVVRCLARIAASLGGEVLVNNFRTLFAIHFGAEDWQSRHAAVLFLGIVAEKCSKPEELKQGWNQMAGRIIRSVDEDMHPHVRWAALYTIKQFSKHLKPEFQDKYHEKVMPVLTKAMDDFSNPRVQVQAYLALFDFTWNCSSSTLKPYLKEIVNKLLKQLQKVNPMVQGETLRVLSAVAHSSRDHFAEYYSSVMPYLKVIMMTANEELDHNHLADSVECITMVWLAVGKDKIRSDIEMVVQLLLSLQGSKLEENDPMRSQLLQAWARLGKCLGQEFRPYMSVAIPLLIKSAKIGSYVIIPKNPDEVDESDGSIRALILGDRKIWIKTKVLEEKLKACEGLYLLADELKEGLSVWIEKVARTLVPRLKFEHSEEIRRVAASAMPVLLKSSKVATQEGYLERSADESPFKKLCSYVVPALVKALSKESLPEIATIILDSLDECMKMSEHVLDEDQTDLFLKTIMNVLQKISSLSRSRVGAIEGINQTLPHEENGEEQKVYDKAADCLTTFIRTHKNTFSPFIGKLAPCIELMWVRDRIVEERRTALHVFCDVAKQFQEEAFRRYKISLLFLFKACKDENPEVQEVAAQAIGTAAEFGGSVFKSSVKGALSALNAVMGHPKALEMEYVMAHDTAVSALGKILEFHREKLKAENVLRIWLGHLPLKNNLEEAKVVHRQLCSLVEVSDVELLGTQKAYLSEIVAVYAEILWAGKKLATEETVNQMIKQLKLHRRRSPHSTWRSIMLSLELHLQKKLESMLTS